MRGEVAPFDAVGRAKTWNLGAKMAPLLPTAQTQRSPNPMGQAAELSASCWTGNAVFPHAAPAIGNMLRRVW